MKLKGKTSGLELLETAQSLAIDALGFLASDNDRLERFFSTTGLDPQTLREQAHNPSTHAAILEHLLQDESLLLVFCANTRNSPNDIRPALEALQSSPQQETG